MTSIQRRVAWQEARQKLNISSQDADWPECLGLRIIGGLYDPGHSEILENVLRTAADRGELVVSREIRQVTRTVQAGGKVRGHFVGFERVPHHYALTESIEVPIEIVTAHAADVARYLDGSGLDLPPILLAWLSPFLGQKEQPAKPVKKLVTKLEQFHNLLSRIEQAWLSSGREQIDRTDWPGTSKELCALAGRLLPETFGNANPDSFYNNYSKAAKLNFHGDAGVSAIYAELFPAESQAARRTDAA